MHKLNTTKKRKIQQNKTVVGSVQSPLTTLGLCPEPTHNQFEDPKGQWWNWFTHGQKHITTTMGWLYADCSSFIKGRSNPH